MVPFTLENWQIQQLKSTARVFPLNSLMSTFLLALLKIFHKSLTPMATLIHAPLYTHTHLLSTYLETTEMLGNTTTLNFNPPANKTDTYTH